jgi:hypothetical protein
MKTRSTRAFAVIEVVAVVAVVGWLAPKIAPSWFDKRTKQAEQSADASAEVEKRAAAELAATQALADARLKVEHAKSAAVSASMQQIGLAAGQLDDSPQSLFIRRETTFVGPWMQPPDPIKLLESERRRVAYLEGRVDLADKLYAQATKDQVAANAKSAREITDLTARAVKAEAKAEAAFASRREVDTDLAESAAYARGKDAVIGVLAIIAVLAIALWLYVRFTSLPKVDIARMANRAREGRASALEVIDAVVPDSWHDSVEKVASKLRAKEAAKKAAREAAARS